MRKLHGLLSVVCLLLPLFARAQGQVRTTLLPEAIAAESATHVATPEEPPDAPSYIQASMGLASTPFHRIALNALPILARPVVAPPAAKRKVLDKKYWLLAAFAVAVTVTDVELTQRCLNHRTCVELNPTLPRSRPGMYLANVPVTGALFYWSYRRKARGQRLWWLPMLIDAGPHAGGSIDNLRFK